MTTERFVPLTRPNLGTEEIEEVLACLRSGWLATGPRVRQFEGDFQAYIGAKHAVAVSSGTAGLHLALLALGIGPGDEVLTTPMTFAATANAICFTGATPIFVDIDERTFNMDVAKLEERISERTRAILPVHFAGQPCAMDEILALARTHGLFVIEDAAHALGAEYKGKKIGTIGDITMFSFHPAKNITTGEGGMVTTDREDMAERVRILRFHGIDQDAWRRRAGETAYPEVLALGFKYNMMDLQAAIGIHQLPRLEGFLAERARYAALYDEAFAAVPEITTPQLAPYPLRHGWHIYPILVDIDALGGSRDEFVRHLKEEKIEAAVHYKALHLQSYYQRTFGYQRGSYPKAEAVSDRILSLPLFPGMAPEDLMAVVETVQRVIHKRLSAYQSP